MSKVIGKGKAYRERGYGYVEFQAPIVECDCGKEVLCDRFTNTCDCGRDYNGFGQKLAPRSQWGEETGESLSDILNENYDEEMI